MIKLCDAISERDMRLLITGTEKDLKLAQDLVNAAKNTKVINACAKTTINQLAALIESCSVYISADSAPLHIAAAVGTPFVALFGPTEPSRHLVPVKKYVLIKKVLPCSPCYRSKCKTSKCMQSISAEEVLEAIDQLLR
jgi:ADP-heptose:LPS heptosyltransferase